MNKRGRIVLFSYSYPYGTGETFLENELPFLAERFSSITIFPLTGKGKKREIKQNNIQTAEPILDFDLKNKTKLLKTGIFCRGPIFFSFKELFQKNILLNSQKTWLFFTSLLTIRATLSNKTKISDIITSITSSDILYSYWGDKMALLIPFLKKKTSTFPKTIVRFHGSDLYEEAKGYIPFREMLFRNIDIACPISENGAEYLKEKYPGHLKRIVISRLGSPNHNKPTPQKTPSSAFHIISCSNIIELKRVSLIAKSLKMIGETNILWTHIGDGPLMDDLKKETENLPSNIKTELLGRLPSHKVIDYYSTHYADLFINVSRSEGIPVSIMEALSFGIPILATNVGGIKEIVTEKCGTLLPQNITPEQLSQAIIKFTTLKENTITNMRTSALEEWQKKWNADTNYQKFTSLLSETLPNP